MTIEPDPADSSYYAFRGTEILCRREGRAYPLPFHPFPGLEPSGKGWLLDSFPLYPGGPARHGPGQNPTILFLAPEAEAPEDLAWVPFRTVLGSSVLTDTLPACRALALAGWRANSRHCGRCGAAQQDKPDETARLCISCGLVTYPRISPAVLVLVRKGDRILLARNSAFRTGVYSVLAGFVEPGESFEDCAAREVREEVGLQVSDVRYLGSQPWPFPDSLMVGFEADWVSGDLAPDGVEIMDAGWYSGDDHPQLPLPGSLSRRIIDAALGPTPPDRGRRAL
ncbi:MAG TPA: NAD(+) diphosphatase [Magnetospirillaceae bacterium]|nr:NAD(+) diphosphatase [Magnetospirillaceae bacterium]